MQRIGIPVLCWLRKRYQGPSPLRVRQYEDRDFLDVVENEVVGGMSVFYGGASLRLREEDLVAWPILYGDLAPHYDCVERLLEVHGEAGTDPCEPPRIGAICIRLLNCLVLHSAFGMLDAPWGMGLSDTIGDQFFQIGREPCVSDV